MKLTRDQTAEAVFGGFDGATSIMGVILGILIVSGNSHVIFVTALGGAISAGVSMGGGDFLSQDRTNWGLVAVMALASFTGSVLPGVPYAIGSGPAALAASLAIALAITLVIAVARYRLSPRGRWEALWPVVALMAISAALSAAAVALTTI